MPQSMRAQALLAKVYMYMSGTFENPNKEYAQLSYNYANEVIESNQFSLLSRSTFMTYNELAPDAASQTETIFAVKFIASDWDDWGSPLGSMYAEIDGQGWGEVYASAKYMDLLHETGKNTDAREALSIHNIRRMMREIKFRLSVSSLTCIRTERFPVMYIVRVRQRK